MCIGGVTSGRYQKAFGRHLGHPGSIWEASRGIWEALRRIRETFGGIWEAWELARGTPDPATLPIRRENATSRVPAATNQIDARLQDYKLHNNNATRLQPYRDYKAAGLQDYKTT